jgi:hypothetical protein
MGPASPLDLLMITVAVAAIYGAIVWRFLLVPAQRRRTAPRHAVVQVRASTRQPMPRQHLRLVVDNSSRA